MDPLRRSDGNEVQVVRSKAGEGLQNQCSSSAWYEVAIPETGSSRNCRARLVQRLHGGHDVGHGFRGEAGDGGTADVLDRPDEPGRQSLA